MFTHDPWARYRIHPDHRAVGFTALAAIVTAGNQMLREGPPPHSPGEVCLFHTDNADFWVDITDTFELKLRAVREHRSQTAHSGEAMMKRVREWAEAAGNEALYRWPRGSKLFSHGTSARTGALVGRR